MDRWLRVFLHWTLAIVALQFAGCGARYQYQAYQPPKGAPLIEVEFRALDLYRNADYVAVSLYERRSCDVKPVLKTVAELQTTPIWDDDIYQTVNQLPSGKNLAFHISNVSDSGYVTSRCENLQAYVLMPGSRYSVRIRNWSTPGTGWSKFGCAFDVYRLSTAGDPVETVPPAPPAVAVCG